MEALVLEYENKEALEKALEVLKKANTEGIVASPLSTDERQLIGKRRLVALKEKIEAEPGGDDCENISEEEITAIVNEVRQKRYDERQQLSNHH